MSSQEKIVSVAFRRNDLVISLPQPNRHGDVIKHMVQNLNYEHTHDFEQGFTTSSRRYVNRIEGAEIAIRSGQITKLNWPPNLFSEDLW